MENTVRPAIDRGSRFATIKTTTCSLNPNHGNRFIIDKGVEKSGSI